MRLNLDPYFDFKDDDIIKALELCRIKYLVENLDKGLYDHIYKIQKTASKGEI